MSIEIVTGNLAQEILLNPFLRGEADSLNILSGYASASIASRHLQSLSEISDDFSLRLAIGMIRDGAVTQSSHLAFQRLMTEFYPDIFSCHYMPATMPIHSKVYVWSLHNNPVRAWCCSANYTQAALYNNRQQEVASECDPLQAFNIFQDAFNFSLSCCSHAASECVVADRHYQPPIDHQEVNGEETVEWSLLSEHTDDGLRYGINWGHRGTRNRNEAYIPIPSVVYNTNFFPDRPNHFTVRTDDGHIFTCVREQDNGKAITTPLNNSDIGMWLRERIGLHTGARITADDLVEANAHNVVFTKTNDDEYLLMLRGE